MAGTSTSIVRGRDDELAWLGEQLDGVRRGIGTVVLVEGGPGMGKSRLLEEARMMARRLSFRVGSGVAEPADGLVELAPVLSALFDGPDPVMDRDALGELTALQTQRYWFLQDLWALLEQTAMQAPVLVCLDDLQWSDSGTVAALRGLWPRLATVPVAWILACRPEGGSTQFLGAIKQLERNGGGKIVLGPLSDAAVAQVAADVLRAEPDAAVLKMTQGALGSPFLLTELLAGLRDERLVLVENGRAELLELRLPKRFGETVGQRLERTSEPARRAASAAASLGRQFSVSELATMLGVSAAALLEPVGDLIDAAVFVESGDRLAFQHDLVREAVRSSLSSSMSRALDRQAAEVLLSCGALPVEVARQLAASAGPGDDVAIVTLWKAADALAGSDPGVAADLSQRALELAPAKHPLRGALVAQTAVVLHASGRSAEAKRFAETSLRATLPAAHEAEVLLSIAGMSALSPDVRVDAGRRALHLHGLPIDLRARHLTGLVYNLLTAGRPDEARTWLEEARSAMCVSGDPAAAVTLAHVEGGLLFVDGDFGLALEMIESAARLVVATGDETRERVPRIAQHWRCGVLMMLDRLDEALQQAAECIAVAERDRQGRVLQMFEILRGRQLLEVGRLTDAAATLARCFGSDRDDPTIAVDVSGVLALGRVALHVGDARQARRAADVGRILVEESTPEIRRQAAWLLALQAMADSDPPRAREWLNEPAGEGNGPILPLFSLDITGHVQLVRIAVAASDRDLAESAVAAAEQRSAQNPNVRSIAGAASHARGLAHASRQDLAAAVESFDGGPRPLPLASALEDLGLADIERGATTDGIAALDRALVHYVATGASRDAARVRGRLRALGVRRRRASVERTERGWAAMTDSELGVAHLVVDGLTNREVAERLFLSPHTVSSHLRQIFAKLEINSRVELARLAVAQDRRP